MPTNIGPVIGIDGEKEYRKQINQIIQQAKTLDAEMKAVTSSFDSQNDIQKKLTAQSESLTKQIENQEKRIDLLQQMTDKAAQKYGEADTRTLKWRQAVADATTTLNKMKSELSQVNQELEENASASGTSHLDRLTGAIQDQERELEGLKTAYQEAVLAKGRDSQEAQDAARKIQALSADLKENKMDMQQLALEADALSGELDDAGNSAKSFQDKMDAAFSTVDKIGTGLSVGVTAPLVALGTAGVKTYLDLDDAASRLVRQTGAATEETEKYRDILEEVYKGGYGESYEDIANSMATVRQNLGEIDDLDLRILTEDALTLRDTFEYDVTESTRAAKAMMDNFGISAEDAFNYIVTGSQNGLNYSGELLDSISEYSVQFAKVGMDADDMFNIFAEGYETGAWNIDKVGDAIKEFSNLVLGGSESTINALKNMGLNVGRVQADVAAGGEKARDAFFEVVTAIAETEDPFRQATEGTAIFGTMWEDLGPEVVTQLANISDETYDAEGAMDALNDSMSDAQKAEKNMREAQSALSDIGESVVEIGLPALESLSGILSDVADWFDSLDDGGKNMVLTLGGIAVAAGPTVKAIGKIGSAVSGAKKFLDSFKTSTDAASGAMEAIDAASEGASGKVTNFGSVLTTVGGAAGIVGIATGALLGLGAALDEAWKNDQIDRWSNFASGAQTFVEAMQNADASLEGFDSTLFASAEKQQALADNMQTIQTRITEICQTASSERRGYTQGEVTELENLFTQLSETTEQTYSMYTAQIQAIETQAVDAAGQAGQVGINEYIQLANDWTAKATAAYQEQTQAIEESKTQQLTLLNQQYTTEAERQSQAYQDEYNRIVSQADERLRLAQESVANVTSAYMQGMEQYVDIQDLMQQKTSWHNQRLQEIQQNHANMMIAIQQDFAGDEEDLQGAMERENARYANARATAWTDLAEGMDKSQADALAAYLGMATYTETYGGEISATTRSMVTGIIQSVDMLPDEVKTPVQDMMSTLKNTMQTQAPDLWAAATDIGSGIANAISRFVHFSRPDEGPLRYYDRWMPDFAKGLARSAKKSLPTVRKIGDDMAKALTPTLPDYSRQVQAAMEQMARVEQQAQIYSDLQSDGITVNWDGSPADYPASTIQITVNAAPGQSEEQIADAVAYRLQHQVQQQRRGRL